MSLHGNYEPSTYPWVREQVQTYERSDGREGATMDGLPVVILTTVGARTGALRKSPVMRIENDGVYAAVGSVGGQPQHPAWYRNLINDPRCELQDGPDKRSMVAREADGDERREWWARATAIYPHYQEMQDRTVRQIPVMLLEP